MVIQGCERDVGHVLLGPSGRTKTNEWKCQDLRKHSALDKVVQRWNEWLPVGQWAQRYLKILVCGAALKWGVSRR